MSYYNTLSETGDTLKQSQAQTEAQDAMVLKFFQENPYGNFTPFEVCDGLGISDSFKFSIARSMTNLTDEGKLIMLPQMKMERRGRMNHLWALKVEIGQQKLSL